MNDYIGDGLYVADDGYQLKLFTLDGNEVYLDVDTLHAFIKYVERVRHVSISVTPNE